MCEQHTSHLTVSRWFTFNDTHMRGSSSSLVCAVHISHHLMCHHHAFMLCVWFSTTSLLSSSCFLSSIFSYRPVFSFWPSASSTMWWTNSLCTPAIEDLGTLAEYDPLTGYEPNDYHISETTEPYIQESTRENGSLNSHDPEYDDCTIGMALSSPLFIQERQDAESRRRVYHSHDERLSSSQSSSVGHRTGRPLWNSLTHWSQTSVKIRVAAQKNEQIRILLERQREQILADCHAEIRKHEFHADYDRRSIQKLNEVIESQRGEIYRANQGDAWLRRDQQLLHEQLLEQTRDLREAHEKSLNDMEELKKFHGSTFDTSSRRKLVEDRDTILELTGKIQELQNELNCMNDAREFQDVFSTQWIIPRYQLTSVFPTFFIILVEC